MKTLKTLVIILVCMILFFTACVFKLYNSEDWERYHLYARVWDIYQVLGIPLLVIGIIMLVKRVLAQRK